MRWPRPWRRPRRTEGEPSGGEPAPNKEEGPKTLWESAILFARDVAVAFLVVAIVIAGMTLYTQVWPPMVVVESDSMQHSSAESFVGVIDTGDLVLVQAVGQRGDVVTHVEGRVNGHETYSDFGDVIIFHPPSVPLSGTPIIHRAIAYVLPNASGGVDVPSLAALPPGEWTARAGQRDVTAPYGITQFTIQGVGFRAGRSFAFDVSTVESAGYLTMGDHNSNPDSWVVPLSRILGRARGELPWFGLVKLTLFPTATGCCPAGWGDARAPQNSWDALLVSLILIIVGPFAADFAWGYWKERRRSRGRPREAAEEAKEPMAADNPGEAPPPEPEGLERVPPEDRGPLDEPPKEPPPTDDRQTGSAGPGGGGP